MRRRGSMTSALADIVDRRRAALVVVDVQNDFVESQTSASAAQILPRLKQMLTAARKVGVKIVYTQAFVSDLTSSDVWQSALSKRSHGADFCREGSRGSEIHSEVTPVAGDIVIPKYRYSAFIGTNLEVICGHTRLSRLFSLVSRPMSASKARCGMPISATTGPLRCLTALRPQRLNCTMLHCGASSEISGWLRPPAKFSAFGNGIEPNGEIHRRLSASNEAGKDFTRAKLDPPSRKRFGSGDFVDHRANCCVLGRVR